MIANKDLRKAAILIEIGMSCKEELKIQRNTVQLLTERVNLKDSIINVYGLKEQAYKGSIETYKQLQANYESTIVAINTQFKSELGKQKKRTLLVAIIGAVVTGLMVIK